MNNAEQRSGVWLLLATPAAEGSVRSRDAVVKVLIYNVLRMRKISE
jgi:hypothetical protein